MPRFTILIVLLVQAAAAQTQQWTEAAANEWYARQPWLVGSNYIPALNVNELEMWQADGFRPERVEIEFGWAQRLGMNTMRVFLHYIPWQEDPTGYKRRIEVFLKIAERHRIRPIFVLLDSCWDPFPRSGQQPAPRPGIHNSRWVQSPGAPVLMDPKQYPKLLEYVQDMIAAFANDKRILAWDLWNEPDNTNGSSYGKVEPTNKLGLVETLLPQVFAYARAGLPTQPLTSGVWHDDWSAPEKLTPIEKTQLELSDVISFHSYDPPEEFEKRVQWLERYHRPIWCTEYMARPRGSTFQAILPIAKKHEVAAINWGFVAGKSQTWLPWDSWQHPYTDRQPPVWFHDIFRLDGTPYSAAEVDFIREMTKEGKAKAAGK
ncbi:MAG TPA: glycosyl hydrolase [Bryobacteraceae bacterium]